MFGKYKKYIEQNYKSNLYSGSFSNPYNFKVGDKVFYFVDNLKEYKIIRISDKSMTIYRELEKKNHFSKVIINEEDIDTTLFTSVAKFKQHVRRKIREEEENVNKNKNMLNKELEDLK